MLNAFRHQRKKRRPFSLRIAARSSSAQRLPASKEETRSAVKVHDIRNRCAQRLPASKEETPVTGVIRKMDAACAQRLPASKEETQQISSVAFDQIRQCSTPSGIKGRNALYCRRRRPFLCFVLNAFRHQRKKRSGDVRRLDEGRGVLNAFRHQRKKRPGKAIRAAVPDAGAQRLPASKEETRPRRLIFRLVLVCSTPSGIKGRNACRIELGASSVACAQRLPASKEETQTAPGHIAPGSPVLNAFRHQRKKRLVRTRRRSSTQHWCSTPSGIKGRNASLSPRDVPIQQVLNAFRHQRKKRGRRWQSLRPIKRAQRLPASKEETHFVMVEDLIRFVCSTPSGIKGRNALGDGYDCEAA